MKTAIIVQARMTSTRLPGKVLMTVAGKPLLEYLIERLRRVALADEIIIATTVNDSDEPIVEFCGRLSVPYFRGSEDDVLSRYHEAASRVKADFVVRVTSDCPVIDPRVIDDVISFFRAAGDAYDYASNTLARSYPRGMDTEVFTFRALNEAFFEASEPPEREHVTPFIYRHPERYRIGQVVFGRDASRHRWTVDTPEDFELVSRIIETLYPLNPEFGLEDILALLKDHPQWAGINAHVEQKKLNDGEK